MQILHNLSVRNVPLPSARFSSRVASYYEAHSEGLTRTVLDHFVLGCFTVRSTGRLKLAWNTYFRSYGEESYWRPRVIQLILSVEIRFLNLEISGIHFWVCVKCISNFHSSKYFHSMNCWNAACSRLFQIWTFRNLQPLEEEVWQGAFEKSGCRTVKVLDAKE